MGRRELLQLARVPVLVALLLASGPLLFDGAQAAARQDLDGVWSSWAWLTLLAVAVVAVVHLGRRRRHPPATLAMEGLVAAVLGFVPPFQWVMWFGINRFTEAVGGTTVLTGFMQPLAIAWLGVAAATAAHQMGAKESKVPQGQ